MAGKTYEIDPADPTLPENYLQLRAALDKDCEKYGQVAAPTNTADRNQAGSEVSEKRHDNRGQESRGQIAMRFGG